MALNDGGNFRFLYFHPAVIRAEGCPGQSKPFTSCVNAVAAIGTSALNLPRVLRFALAGVAVSARSQAKPAVRQGSGRLQYRLHSQLELGACRGCCH